MPMENMYIACKPLRIMALIILTLRLQRNKPFLDQIGSFRIMVAVKPPQSLRWCQMTIMASRITGQSSVCSTVCSHWQQKRNIKGPCYSPFVRGIHQWPVDSPAQKHSNAENASIWLRHNRLLMDSCWIGTTAPGIIRFSWLDRYRNGSYMEAILLQFITYITLFSELHHHFH